jgi:hypothetical protein
MIKFTKRLTVAAATLTFAFSAALANPQPTRVKIASINHHENGCSESSRTFVVDIPNPERLDLDYKGALAGIEIREVEANNGHSYGDLAFTNGRKSFTVTLHAKGAGTRLNNPFNSGSVCVDGAGASEGVEVYVHLKE